MRFVLAMVLAGLVASPLSASAQAGEEARAGDEHSLSFWHDEALKIALFSSPPLGTWEYTLELREMENRVRAAKIGLGVSAGLLAAGGFFFGFAFSGDCLQFCLFGAECPPPPPRCGAFTAMGAVLSVGGLAGMITTGIMLRRRKRDRESLLEARYGTPRRVQWDLAQSRLVF